MSITIPILQAKFYYIPPLAGRFQTFWGIDMKFNSPLQRLSCMMLKYRVIEIVSTIVEMKSCYINSPCGELKFHMQYRNVNPPPRRKRDW